GESGYQALDPLSLPLAYPGNSGVLEVDLAALGVNRELRFSDQPGDTHRVRIQGGHEFFKYVGDERPAGLAHGVLMRSQFHLGIPRSIVAVKPRLAKAVIDRLLKGLPAKERFESRHNLPKGNSRDGLQRRLETFPSPSVKLSQSCLRHPFAL